MRSFFFRLLKEKREAIVRAQTSVKPSGYSGEKEYLHSSFVFVFVSSLFALGITAMCLSVRPCPTFLGCLLWERCPTPKVLSLGSVPAQPEGAAVGAPSVELSSRPKDRGDFPREGRLQPPPFKGEDPSGGGRARSRSSVPRDRISQAEGLPRLGRRSS